MKNSIKAIVSAIFCCGLALNAFASGDLLSPNGAIAFNLRSDDGELRYSINYKSMPVILESEMGIDGWTKGMRISRIESSSVDQKWRQVYGERAEVKDSYSENRYIIKSDARNDSLAIIVRAYDEGIAFRYEYLGNRYLHIASEQTTFHVPENTVCWFASFAQSDYRVLPIKDWPGESERPLTMKLANGLYVSLAEAQMVNYCRTKFAVRKGESNIIRCSMYDAVEEIAPFATPWRVVMVAEKAVDLINNNDIILNLNPPCEISDPEWIRPGRVFRCVTLTTDGAKKAVDFAVKRGLNYIHLDAGWYGPEASKASDPRKSDVDPARCPVNDLDIPTVVEYAKSKGVGVWLYVNQRALAEYLDEILPLYESWGVAGVKFGFVHVGSFRWTTWLHDAVRKCAEHHLMVDIHDEYRPTGFSRTYPNLLTQEGIRGNEEFPDGNTNTILPYTRYLCGAADATICYFHRKELKPDLAKSMNTRSLINTSCHQMALSVIDYSPLQFLYWYDKPEDVTEEPELFFFDGLPTTWDDSKALEGEIGEYLVMARRKGKSWYVGTITNNDARDVEIPLDFLDKGKKYEMTLFTDGGKEVKSRTHVAINKKKVSSKDKIKLTLKPRGGAAMIISEQ
jgi:alpha-glucosidase